MTRTGEDGGIGLVRAAVALARALRRESALARSGAIPDLLAAARAKQAAFAAFRREGAGEGGPSAAEIAALRELVAAADENLLVLDAVRSVFEQFAVRVREALCSAADPGVYDAAGRARGRVLAARVNAVV